MCRKSLQSLGPTNPRIDCIDRAPLSHQLKGTHVTGRPLPFLQHTRESGHSVSSCQQAQTAQKQPSDANHLTMTTLMFDKNPKQAQKN